MRDGHATIRRMSTGLASVERDRGRVRTLPFSVVDPSLSFEVGSLIARGRKVIWRAADRALAEHGESMHEFQLVACLVRVGPSAQRDLALATSQHPAAVSRLLDALEARGFVRRRRDREDRRRRRVDVIPAGRAWIEERTVVVARAVERVLLPLRLAERRELRRLLRKIVDAEVAAS